MRVVVEPTGPGILTAQRDVFLQAERLSDLSWWRQRLTRWAVPHAVHYTVTRRYQLFVNPTAWDQASRQQYERQEDTMPPKELV